MEPEIQDIKKKRVTRRRSVKKQADVISSVLENPVETVTPVYITSVSYGKKITFAVLSTFFLLGIVYVLSLYEKEDTVLPVSDIVEEQSGADAIDSLVLEVEKIMLLPDGEIPTVGTVNDAQALAAQQPFYINAQNGDVVLIYQKAGRAILYRPSEKRIINATPIIIEGDVESSQSVDYVGS